MAAARLRLPVLLALVVCCWSLIAPAPVAAQDAPETPDSTAIEGEPLDEVVADALAVVQEEWLLIREFEQQPTPIRRSQIIDEVTRVDQRGAVLLRRLEAFGTPLPVLQTALGLIRDWPPLPGAPTRPPQQPLYERAVLVLETDPFSAATLPPPARPIASPQPATDQSSSVPLVALGAIVGLIMALFVIRSSRDRRALADLANADPLTGLANRRRLSNHLDRLGSIASGKAEPISVAMIDMDHFKSINDLYGHEAGDEVLRRVARVIEASVRPDDVVYRYGGEEFCVLLPGAEVTEAEEVGQRILRAVSDLTVDSVERGLSVSVGISCGQQFQTESVLRLADDALLSAKRQGRNRVAVG